MPNPPVHPIPDCGSLDPGISKRIVFGEVPSTETPEELLRTVLREHRAVLTVLQKQHEVQLEKMLSTCHVSMHGVQNELAAVRRLHLSKPSMTDSSCIVLNADETKDVAEMRMEHGSTYSDRSLQRWCDMTCNWLDRNRRCEMRVEKDATPKDSACTAESERERQSSELLDQIIQRTSFRGTDTRISYSWWSFFIVPPFSKRRICWDVVGCCLLIYDIVMLPMQVFEPDMGDVGYYLQWVGAIFFLCDLPLSFLVGFHHADGYLEMRPEVVARRYLHQWFICDVIIVAMDWLYLLYSDMKSLKSPKVLRIIRVVHSVRIVRVSRKVEVIKLLQNEVTSDFIHMIIRIARQLLILVTTNHFWCCLWFWLGSHGGNDSWVNKYTVTENIFWRYLTSYHWSITQFTPASMEVQPQNAYERAFAILTVLLGMIFFSSFVSNITATITQLRQHDRARLDQEHDLRRFLADANISAELSHRVYSFVRGSRDMRYKLLASREVRLLQILPRSMLQAVHTEQYTPVLVQHPFFKAAGRSNISFLCRLCNEGIKTKRVLACQEHFSKGQVAEAMCFITTGLFQYTEKLEFSSLIPHMEESADTERVKPGEWTSECSLWIDRWEHKGWLTAAEHSEIAELSPSQFKALTKDLASVQRYAVAFVEELQQGGSKSESDTFSDRALLNRLSDQAFSTTSGNAFRTDSSSSLGSFLSNCSSGIKFEKLVPKWVRYFAHAKRGSSATSLDSGDIRVNVESVLVPQTGF